MEGMKKKKGCPEGYCKGVKVGSKGQIVIPIELREDLNIKPGDTVILCKRGYCIEVIKSNLLQDVLNKLTSDIK